MCMRVRVCTYVCMCVHECGRESEPRNAGEGCELCTEHTHVRMAACMFVDEVHGVHVYEYERQ